MSAIETRALGAHYLGDNRCSFLVWAPAVASVELHIVAPDEQTILMRRGPRGYHVAIAEGVAPGSRYLYRLDEEKERPDPASRAQPEGPHAASEVVDPHFAWNDTAWSGIPLQDYIIYELHIGTFTHEGTFDAVIPHLDHLKELGVTALEIMPVAVFPGSRNWGYDGTYPFSVHTAYGGPEGLKRMVDACHQRGLAVVLDVVYNHFGPEGNYLWDYAPQFFTSRYQTPWGAAVNFDGPHSDEVRRYFIENALMWYSDYHIDALRLDAVHAITDFSAQPFMAELAEAIHRRAEQLNRRIYTIAESDQNDRRLVTPPAIGGYGLDSQWSDDFHHTIHTLLSGETDGYYADFGQFRHLARVYRDGWIYAGDYSPFRQRRHGSDPGDIAPGQLVVCTQNHDQVGNRMLGERLTALVSFDALKLAASALLLSPFVPMLFMGEEYGEPAPFLYFVSHGDPGLVEAVRNGRKEEFSSFAWQGEPPDPQDDATFARSRLDHSLREQGHHQVLYTLYRELMRLRKTLPALALLSKEHMQVTAFEHERVLRVHRWSTPYDRGSLAPAPREGGREIVALFSLNAEETRLSMHMPPGKWRLLLNTAAEPWHHPDHPASPVQVPSEVSGQPGDVVTLTFGPYACVLFSQLEDDEEER